MAKFTQGVMSTSPYGTLNISYITTGYRSLLYRNVMTAIERTCVHVQLSM